MAAMERGHTAWDEAVTSVTRYMSDQGGRERRRHARGFASWCALSGLDPARVTSSQLAAYLQALGGTDRQLRTKARTALRAVLRMIDPAHAARAAGIGNCTSTLERYEGTPVGDLVAHFLAEGGSRRAVRKAGLTRLLAWCSEVDIEPTDLHVADLIQFRQWLNETRAYRKETVSIAKRFIALRHSDLGRSLLRERERPSPALLIETADPLQPLFRLDDVRPIAPCQVRPWRSYA